MAHQGMLEALDKAKNSCQKQIYFASSSMTQKKSFVSCTHLAVAVFKVFALVGKLVFVSLPRCFNASLLRRERERERERVEQQKSAESQSHHSV
jgi:hypothetical protein